MAQVAKEFATSRQTIMRVRDAVNGHPNFALTGIFREHQMSHILASLPLGLLRHSRRLATNHPPNRAKRVRKTVSDRCCSRKPFRSGFPTEFSAVPAYTPR
ncbi:MAG: hypothetical protein V5B33_18310 [Candidatus Accumulibacter sp. UW20]